MNTLLQVAVIGVVTALLVTLIRQSNAELALLLTIAACVLMAIAVIRLVEPVISFCGKLQTLSGLDDELLTPLIKSVGIGIVTQLCAAFCTDAGENAVARLIELCGGILAIYVALPLLEAVIDMIRTMMGG